MAHIQFRFTRNEGAGGGQFVEVETQDGKSIRLGEWHRDGEYDLLVFTQADVARILECVP